jgi:hypothetical protein
MTEVISEAEFLALVEAHSQNFLKIYNLLRKEAPPYTRKFYARLIEESEELESFLDDYGARDNKTWYLFRELVACIRNIAKVAAILKHIINRYPSYDLSEGEGLTFLKDAQTVSTWLDETVHSLYDKVKKESKRLNIKFPRGTLKGDFLGDLFPQKRLPYTIDEEEGLNVQEKLTKIATQFLHVSDAFTQFGWNYAEHGMHELKGSIPDKVDEEKSRQVLALTHNLQSTYDHYVRYTPLESEDVRLKRLRGYISVSLHLLNVVNWLSHLYQRHLQTPRRSEAGYEISKVIDQDKVLEIVINFALFHTNRYLQAGNTLAAEILTEYTEIDSIEAKIPEKLGFHLRPATLVAKVTKYYGTKVSLNVGGKTYDAGNVLSITLAAGLIARRGYKKVVFKGDKRVLEDLELLSEYNYGEDEKGNPTSLPPQLSYLWT